MPNDTREQRGLGSILGIDTASRGANVGQSTINSKQGDNADDTRHKSASSALLSVIASAAEITQDDACKHDADRQIACIIGRQHGIPKGVSDPGIHWLPYRRHHTLDKDNCEKHQ